MTAPPQSLNGSGDAELGDPGLSAVEAITQAAQVAAQLTARAVSPTLTLTNGIVLNCRAVPPLAIREAQISQPAPRPPVLMNEAKGREEENPNDPDYIAAVQVHAAHQLSRVSDTMMLLGTAVASLPEWAAAPESDEWIEPLEALGIVINRENKYQRYLAWLRLYACVAESDVVRILRNVTGLSGVTEEEVQRAAAAFRGTS